MRLERLWVRGLRNIQDMNIELHPRCNVFIGENGSGKTSILEAIYLLSRGQSFRSRRVQPLIQFDQSELTVFGKTEDEHRILISKNNKGHTKVLLNDRVCPRVSELAKLIPCQLFHQDLFQIIDASPQIRRRLLDWGLFYLYPDYAIVYRDFQRVLQQRNLVLKQKGSMQELRAWNDTFVDLAKKLDGYRHHYAKQLHQGLQMAIDSVSSVLTCHLVYQRGWDDKFPLAHVLIEQEMFDRKMGYTHAGPHHADLSFLSEHGKGKCEWSRGQQKLLLILLKIAQSQIFQGECIFLFDDLHSELDEARVQALYQQIRQLAGQSIFTALDDSASHLPIFEDSRWFYLHQGHIEKITDL
ncbi:MAG: replication and repair protein RecF [Pseudomonadota bacterium]|nr:replication and repair protein RecF [Pseudomonadota bacterium]